MAGDPKYPGSQGSRTFPYHRYAELFGLQGIYWDAPRRVGQAWAEALASDRPVRARGQGRPRGAAAAAAHHRRTGEEDGARMVGRPRARRRDAEVAARQAAGVQGVAAGPEVDGDRRRHCRRAAQASRVHDPDRRARVRRDARVGLDDDRRRRGALGRARRPRLHVRGRGRRRPRRRASSRDVVEGRDAFGSAPRTKRWAGRFATSAGPGSRGGDLSGRPRALGSEGAAARPAARRSCSARRATRCRSTAAAGSARTRRGGRRAARRLGRRGHPTREDEGRARGGGRRRRGSRPRGRQSATTRSSSSTRTARTAASRRSRWAERYAPSGA